MRGAKNEVNYTVNTVAYSLTKDLSRKAALRNSGNLVFLTERCS